jgi:DNA polymerase elongation subunit (family B)
MNKIKILLFDIETAPMKAYVWSQYDVNYIPSEMVISNGYILCWCAKWLGDKHVISKSLIDYPIYKKIKDSDKELVKDLRELLNEADVVVTQNGVKFDVKYFNTRCIVNGIKPPSPFKNVDTLQTARKAFLFTSNKLNDLGELTGCGNKIETGGFKLWKGCLSGDMLSWKKMVRYCKQDVKLLEKVYSKFLPYIRNHPNQNVYNETKLSCPKCGSGKLNKKGFMHTLSGKKQQYQCISCGGWCSEGKVIKNA